VQSVLTSEQLFKMSAPGHFISDLAQAEEHFHPNVLRVQPVYEDRSSDLDLFLKENEVGEEEQKNTIGKSKQNINENNRTADKVDPLAAAVRNDHCTGLGAQSWTVFCGSATLAVGGCEWKDQ
jgi:hypothetical protein